jgi:Arc/MetJ-type ribon-helix-helix transcriptional regulator
MSSHEEELKRLKEDIEKITKDVTDLINAHLSRLSEIDSGLGAEVDRDKLWGELAEIKGLRHQARAEIAGARESILHGLREIKEKIRAMERESPAIEAGEAVEEIAGRFEDLEGSFEDKLGEIEDKFENFSDRIEETEVKIRERIREFKQEMREEVRRASARHGDHVAHFSFPDIRIPEIKVPDVGKIFEESISKAWSGVPSKAWSGVPSAIVSSVRLPQVDVNLIDNLVGTGIFKSRNEGIAFFAHRGIEASQEWLTKVREKLDEIHKLQEETKKEIEGVTSESKPASEGGQGDTSQAGPGPGG